MNQLKQHPLSAAFPAMPEPEFRELVEDIRQHGQRDPILIHEGMVLDGWHRYRACTELGIKPKSFTFGGGDPIAFVESVNLHRRHLSASQRAMAVVTLKQWATAGNPNVAAAATLKATNEEMAREAKVSPRTIRDAKAAQKAGLAEPVRDGAMTVEEAAKLARGKDTAKPAKGPGPASAPAPAVEEEHFGPTPEELAAQEREEADERAALQRLLDSDDKLATLAAENKKLRALNRVLEERVNGLLSEKSAAVASAKKWQRKCEAAERRLKEAA